MKTRLTRRTLISRTKYFFFEKKFSSPRASVLALLLVPLVAYPLTLADYENTATVASSPDQFETDLTNNSSSIQVTPNAEIVIVKEVVNDDGGSRPVADFGITSSAGPLIFDSGTTTGDTTTYTADKIFVAPGTYSFSELAVDGYTEGSWSCTAGVVNSADFDNGSVTLDVGQSTVCAIVNDDLAPQLTLLVNVTNDDGGLLTAADFFPAVGTTPFTSGIAQSVAANTPLDVLEIDVPGYSEATWSCVDANNLTPPASLLAGAFATGGTPMSLAPGSDVTCTIVNDDIAPQLTLTKNIINDHGGDLIADDFDISIDVVGINNIGEVPSGVAQTVTANTGINISEVPVSGYLATGDWSCIDSSGLSTGLPATVPPAGGTAIQLAPGATVNCEITNDDVQPTLTLVKTILNDNGGTGIIDDFDISIDVVGINDLGEVQSGVANPVTANTPIIVSEIDLPQYAEGNWVCADVNGVTTDPSDLGVGGIFSNTQVILKPGSEVTCEITNNDLGIDLSIEKFVSNTTPNVGDVVTFRLEITNAGPDIATNATVTDVVLSGFSYELGSISGGTSSDDNDPAGAGLTWNLASVPVNVGSPVILTFDATVNAP